uniref:2-(3-amino-3-carboxypropyl)histidine synthase n=1 Tax=Fervidicoccus fontis TaxID=683846 RepID=A0A7J3ZLK3_9CREN
MSSLPYDFEVDRVVGLLERHGYKRVLLQLPEGLKKYAAYIARELKERAGVRVYIYGGQTWGPCDVPYDEARRLEADLIVHYGHLEHHGCRLAEHSLPSSPLGGERWPHVVFIPARSVASPSQEHVDRLAHTLALKGARRPILIATAQHLHLLEWIRELLERRGLEPLVETGAGGVRGLVVGCDYSALLENPSRYDSVVVVSSGVFHALGASLVTEKPVFQLDPYSGETRELCRERELWLKRRYATILRALGARSWAIWIGGMRGQYRPRLVEYVIRLVEKRGGEWYLFYSRYVTTAELKNSDSPEIDAHVITSCPRIALDDFTLQEYEKPVLSPGEAIMVLTESLEPYRPIW